MRRLINNRPALTPPAGTRDLLPPEAARRRAVARSLTETFERFGYELITTPPFEYEATLERGLEMIDRRDLLRFVEPETGETALLRPDFTPQIARVVASHAHERPSPWRLYYEGTVVRRQRKRARRQRQVTQVGVEHIGSNDVQADAEILELACATVRAAGLTDFFLELRHPGFGGSLLGHVDSSWRSPIAEALSSKDHADLRRLLRQASVPKPIASAIARLPELYGDKGVLKEAKRMARSAPMKTALRTIHDVIEHLSRQGLAARIRLDLGELRGMSYYTGLSFALLAHGPGEPIGSGGRYDDLLGRFGTPLPATGFAIDVDHLSWALERAGAGGPNDKRLRLVARGSDKAIERLRAEGVIVARWISSTDKGLLEFARAWGYSAAAIEKRGSWELIGARDGKRQRIAQPLTASVIAERAQEK